MTSGQSNQPKECCKTLTRREREIENRKQLILDAATQVFRGKCVGQATMGEIASVAELSKGTLYLYFKSKEDLLLALANRMLDQVFDACMAANKENIHQQATDRFAAMLLAYADVVQSNEDQFRAMVAKLTLGTPEDVESPEFLGHRERVSRVMNLLMEVLREGHRDGSVQATLDPVGTALEAWGGLVGVLLISFNFEHVQRRVPDQIASNNLVSPFVSIFTRGLRDASLDTRARHEVSRIGSSS